MLQPYDNGTNDGIIMPRESRAMKPRGEDLRRLIY